MTRGLILLSVNHRSFVCIRMTPNTRLEGRRILCNVIRTEDKLLDGQICIVDDVKSAAGPLSFGD